MASLMQLPQELHLQILRHLDPFPTAMLLRLANRYFHNLIRPLGDEEMMDGLEHRDYCASRGLRYCTDCHRLRPSEPNFVPRDLFLAALDGERSVCIECGTREERRGYARGTVFRYRWQTRVLCDDCSDLPKDSVRRFEDLCRECWEGLEASRRTRPLWKEGMGEEEEEALKYRADLFRSTARLHHGACCRKCWRDFRGCESLMEGLRRGEKG